MREARLLVAAPAVGQAWRDGGNGEAVFVFVCPDHLRILATTLAEDPRRGDHVADLVLRDGAHRMEVQPRTVAGTNSCGVFPIL
jgi:hypothetical protein